MLGYVCEAISDSFLWPCVPAHLSLLVNIGVVYLGLEVDLGRLERVLGREVDLDAKRPLVVGWILLRRWGRRIN